MRGHARIPQTAKDIELAGGSVRADNIANETDFIIVAGVSEAHRRLVERREEQSVGTSARSELERAAEIPGGEFAAGEGCFADCDAIELEIGQIDQNRPALACGQLIFRLCPGYVRNEAGDLAAHVENAGIAEYDECRERQDIGLGQQPGE